MDENRKKALAAALTQIEKQFGKGSVMRMGDVGAVRNIEAISTGSLGLDLALGIGGVPKGRVIEIYGPESSGKTTLTLHIIAESQKLGGTAAFVDAEHALDPVYAEKLGVNMTDLLVSQPDTGEQALEITDMLVRSGAVDIVVVDSVAALTPKAEIEGEMGDSHVGLQARLMSQALRKLTGNIKRSNCCVIFINQIRMKIGVMFGSPETTTGGNALKFYASVRLDIRRTGSIKKAMRSSVTRPESRWSRTRSRRPSDRPSSISSMVRASRARVRSSTWAWLRASSTSPAPGTAMTAPASGRARTTSATFCARIPRSPRPSRRASATSCYPRAGSRPPPRPMRPSRRRIDP
jgi:protein RecA